MLPDLTDVPEQYVDEAIVDSFRAWAGEQGISLYPAQEEAILGLAAGDNVVLATPTGSGKSLVAAAAHFMALARGQRTFYTAPIKALVSEKFFSLCDTFGPEKVGMMTGDSTVNASAPIVCATAEIVANLALREGEHARTDQVVMDEFHYYSDPDRGWAWQVPLIELPQAQFLLMSATLGDTSALRGDLSRRTGRETDLVEGSERPVPLDFSYVDTPVHETVERALTGNQAPIYIVHFTQKEATERAQALTSLSIVSEEEKRAIAEEIGSFRFTTTFGRRLRTLVRQGIGVHHAGLLPKYRRLVERLSQKGLLKVICGTDTLGVGINVPIRTVLFTGLAKFDGRRERILNSREFHQIAGRAGRAGFDTKGTVLIEAPEHEIENARAKKKAGDEPKKAKKLKLKSPRKGSVSWNRNTYDKLVAKEPEQLRSRFRVSNAMLINLLARPKQATVDEEGPVGYRVARHLLRGSHNTRAQQNDDILTAVELLRGMVTAGIVAEREVTGPAGTFPVFELAQELDGDFALNQPLAPFALAALELLDPEEPTYSLDIVSVFESILDDPRQVLVAQERAARGEAIAELKADGVDYAERMNRVEDITWPKPLAELLGDAFDTFREGAPWAKSFELSPKSVLRDMIEKAMTFSDLISAYGLARSEGVVLRYLTDCYRTLSHTLPQAYRTEEIDDILAWLGELLRQVDSSLVDEWAELADPDQPVSQERVDREVAFGVEDPDALTANRRAFRIMVRNALFRLVTLFADEREEELDRITEYLDERPDFPAAMDDYFDEFDDVDTGPEARGPGYVHIEEEGRRWPVRQILRDPDDERGYAFSGVVDLDASDEAGEVRFAELRFEEN